MLVDVICREIITCIKVQVGAGELPETPILSLFVVECISTMFIWGT